MLDYNFSCAEMSEEGISTIRIGMMFNFNYDEHEAINVLHHKVTARSNLHGVVIECADLDFALITRIDKLK